MSRIDVRSFALAFVLGLLWGSSSSKAIAQPETPRPTVVATSVEDMPRIDGRLDDAVWRTAAVVSDFIQTEPHEGQAATQPTQVFIAYTAQTLLIGARLADNDASRIVATEYRRDGMLDADDSFEVFLDTFRDKRNAFYFATNPVGVQLDALVRNEGALLTYEWDGVWEVACTRDEEGWTAEIAIPLSTLRFRPDDTEGWGVNFGRSVARTREQSYWAPIDRDWGFLGKWRVSEFGTLTGINGVRPGGRLQVKPYALGGAERDYLLESEDAELRTDVGLDAKVAVSPTLMADFTVNTDFAQVESDQSQVNLTRFPLFFPEKREFFLENAGLFLVGEQVRFEEPPSTLLFFSRRIGLYDDEFEVPIIGGARLTGKLGRYDIGAFDIVTREIQIDEKTLLPRTNYGAVRIKRDIFARSSVGGMFLSKTPAEEGSSNQVVAADATLVPNSSTTFYGFASKSFTPGLTGSSHAAGIDGNWQSDKGMLFGSYVDIGDDFNSEMGFVQRTGIRKFRGSAFVSPRPGRAGIRQVFFGVDEMYIADREGRLESQFTSIGPFILFDNGSLLMGAWTNLAEGLTEPFEIRDDVEIPIGKYRWNQGVLQYMGDRSRTVSVNGGMVFGGFYSGTIRSINVSGRVRPHRRLALSLEYYRNKIDLPIEGGRYTTNLVVSRAVFAFSSRAYIRGLFQYNDDEKEAGANVLFRYTYRPGADLFVVYNEQRDISLVPTAVKHRELLVKMTFYLAPF